jgi:hypothetical protein
VVDSDEPVPKLPRGRGFRLSVAQLIKIAVTAGMLVAVLVLAKPCSNAVSNFVLKFDDCSGSDYELLKPGMTEEQTRAAIECAKRKGAAPSSTVRPPATTP